MEGFQLIPHYGLKPNKTKMQRLLKYFFITGLLSIAVFISLASAQETGTVFGKVVDSATSEELIGANIFLEGTTIGAASDLNGNFIIKNIPSGKYTLTASMIGY